MSFDPNMMIMLLTSLIPQLTGEGGGKEGEFKSTYSKGAQGILDDLISKVKGQGGAADITKNPQYQQGQDWLMSMFNDPEFFKNFEAPLQRQFQEQTVPGLANQFASMGSGGSTGSTAFRNQLGREGSNLSTNIAAMRGQMQQGAIPQLMQYAQQPFQNYMQMAGLATTPTQNVYQPPTGGFLGGILPGLASGFAQGYGQKWGGSMAPGQFPGTT